MRFPMLTMWPLCAALTGTAHAQDLTLELLDTLDISELSVGAPAVYIGTYPASIAWDGSSLFVGGLDGSGQATQTQLAEIQNALGGPGSWAVRAVGGSLATTPPLRGRPGLDFDDTLGLLATHDLGAATPPGQVQIFNRTAPGEALTLVAGSTTGSGIAGPSWDPGPGGAGFIRSDQSVGPLAGTADYRATDPAAGQNVGLAGPVGLDPGDLAASYNALSGPVIDTTGGLDAVWRDLAFHPDGAIAARATQDLVLAERDATNAVTALLRIDDPTDQALVAGNNVAWIDGAPCLAQDAVVWNDRGPGCLGTLPESLRITSRDGTSVSFVIEAGAGAEITAWPRANCLYDFAWDPDEQRLFVMESLTRLVYVLGVCDAVVSDCAPDVNDDGVLDNGDIGAFVALFLAADPGADFNNDGVLDNGDIGAYVASFQAGC
ncbi:MAG: GC-type dockerin domain-anchored protein [Phycisphaerales bacterium JB040]